MTEAQEFEMPGRPPASSYGKGLVMWGAPNSATAGAVRRLRGMLMIRHFSRGCRGVVVCSTRQGDGSSFIAANLAFALSQIGLSTALVDADFSRPAAQNYFPSAAAAQRKKGISAGRTGSADRPELEEAAPNLYIAFAAHAGSASRQEYASRVEFAEFLRDCERNFDAVIVDVPPSSTSAEVYDVARTIGYSLVVGRESNCFRPDIEFLVQNLKTDGVTLIGSILLEQ